MDLTKIMQAKDRVIPGSGFNLVGLDEYEAPGEVLYIISHHATRAEAEVARAEFVAENPEEKTFIYASTDR